MLRLGVAAALVLSAAALVVAALALVESRGRPDEVASRSVSRGGWTAYAPLPERAPIVLEGLMTREQVVDVLGLPDEVFRKNPRAECWAYASPYEIRLCFGPKRRLAWWSVATPPDA